VTVTRPDALPAAQDELVAAPDPGGRRPRIAGWAKVSAGVVVVGLIAVGNLAARNRQENATPTGVSATTKLLSTGTPPDVQLILSVRNNGEPLWLSRPYLSVSGYQLEPHTPFPAVLGAEATGVYVMRLVVPCVDGELRVPAPGDARILLPAVPRSGEQRNLSVAFSDRLLSVLGEQACDFLGEDQTVVPTWSDVRLENNAVTFLLTVSNQGRVRVLVKDITGAGLSVSARGGFPRQVAPKSDLVLRTRLTIPTCAGLPVELDQLHRYQGYEPLTLVGSFDNGQELNATIGLSPEEPLLVAIRDLANVLCRA
jgi:hypothetical protein